MSSVRRTWVWKGRGRVYCPYQSSPVPRSGGWREGAKLLGQDGPHTHTAVTARAPPSSAVVCLGLGHLGHSDAAEAWQCQGRRCHWEMPGAARAHPTAFLTV